MAEKCNAMKNEIFLDRRLRKCNFFAEVSNLHHSLIPSVGGTIDDAWEDNMNVNQENCCAPDEWLIN